MALGQLPVIIIRQRCGRWHWCCHLCDPPTEGSRNSWADIFRISLPRHMSTRRFHHAYVTRGRSLG